MRKHYKILKKALVMFVLCAFTVTGVSPTMISTTAAASEAEPTFVDVPQSHWAYSYIESLYNDGIVKGMTANTFEPETDISRAEIVKLLVSSMIKYNKEKLVSILGSEVLNQNENQIIDACALDYKGDYADVLQGQWYTPYIELGTALKLVNGYDNNSFIPEGKITREEIATCTVNYYETLAGSAIDISNVDMPFTDVSAISGWAVKYMKAAVAKGLLSGVPVGDTFELQSTNNATRAEAATIIKRLIDKLKIEGIIVTPTPIVTETLTPTPTDTEIQTPTPTSPTLTPTSTLSPTSTPTPTQPPQLQNIILGGKINITGKLSYANQSVELNPLADGNFSYSSSWSTNDIEPQIIINLGSPTDIGAVSVVGTQSSSMSVYYKVYISTDGTTWKDAGIDVNAAYTSDLLKSGAYKVDFSKTGLVNENPVNEDAYTFKTLKGSTANRTQPVVFEQTQNAVIKIKVVPYGNSKTTSNLYSSLTEIEVFAPYTIEIPPTPTPVPTPVPTKAPGKIRIATVAGDIWHGDLNFNRSGIVEFINKAAVCNPDVIVLAEGLYTRGTNPAPGEAIDGLLTQEISAKAIEYNCYIVYQMFERISNGKGPDPDGLYNVSILMGRDGKIVGRYVKFKVPGDELAFGTIAGEDLYKQGTKTLEECFPIFQTDFGRVGMEICYDIAYREPTKILSQLGAQIILVPTVGYWGSNYSTLTKDNNVFMAIAGQDSYSFIGFDGVNKNPSALDNVSFVYDNKGVELTGVRDVSTNALAFEPWNVYDVSLMGSYTFADIDPSDLPENPIVKPTQSPPPVPEETANVTYEKIGAEISISGKLTSSTIGDKPLSILTDGVIDAGETNQWTTSVTNPEITIDFGTTPKDVKAISVVGSQTLGQSLYYRLLVSTDGTTWEEAGIDNEAAYSSSKQLDGTYKVNFTKPGLVYGNALNEDAQTFMTLQGAGANIVQPVIFKDTQIGVKKIKVILYGNSSPAWYMWNSVSEIDVFAPSLT